MENQRAYLVLLLGILLPCLFFVPSCSSEGNSNNGPLTETEDFPYHVKLDDNYHLQWNHNSSHIVFQVKVKTLGWIGLGISGHGDMYPGDMVIAWMADDNVHFHDRHATGRVMPMVDTQQDWHLVKFKREENLYNTFTVIRKLDTCDEEEDLPIVDGTTRLIYAYSDVIPDSDDVIPYHGATTRGSKSILLLDPPTTQGIPQQMPDDVTIIDLLNENYNVPSKDTAYACKLFKIEPPVPGKHHLIRYEPVIQKGHEKLVHHMLVFACSKPIEESALNRHYDCFDGTQVPCNHVILAQGMGGTGMDYPPMAGYSIGAPGDAMYFKLETHYNNVQMRSDYVDSSGIRWFITKELRQHDAESLQVLAFFDRFQIIPPHMDNFRTMAYCSPACLEKSLGDGDIRVFGDVLHTHDIGNKMATRHIRDGVELPPIAKDDFYDYDYQETRFLKEHRVIKKNDLLITDCYYDSSRRTNVTYGGVRSRDEMCISFLLYYPKTKLRTCVSRVNYSKDSEPMYPDGLHEFVENADWTLEDIREEFSRNVQTSDVQEMCIYEDSVLRLNTTQPRDFKEYVQEARCKDDGGNGDGIISAIPNHSLVSLACLVSSTILLLEHLV